MSPGRGRVVASGSPRRPSEAQVLRPSQFRARSLRPSRGRGHRHRHGSPHPKVKPRTTRNFPGAQLGHWGEPPRAGSSPRVTPRMHRKFPAAQRVPEGSAHTPCNGATRGNRGDAGAASLWNLAWRRRGSQQLEHGRGQVTAPEGKWRAPRAARGRSRSVRPGMETPGATRPNARQRRRQGCC